MKLIPKDAVVAEIERRIASLESIGSENYLHDNYPKQYAMLVTLKSLKFSIDKFEVKEVDLEKKKIEWIEQLCKYFKANYLYVSGHESFISDFRKYAKNLK